MSFNFSSQASEGEAKSRRDFCENFINSFDLIPTDIEHSGAHNQPQTSQEGGGGGGTHSNFSLSNYSSAGLPFSYTSSSSSSFLPSTPLPLPLDSDEVPLPDSVLEATYELTPLASLPPPPSSSSSPSAPPPSPSEFVAQIPALLSIASPAMTPLTSPLIQTSKPFDLRNLNTIEDFLNIRRNSGSFIDYKSYLTSQTDRALFEILKRLYSIITKSSKTVFYFETENKFSNIQPLIDLLLLKTNKFNLCFTELEKHDIVFFSLSCWGFPLIDQTIKYAARILGLDLRGCALALIKELIKSFSTYALNQIKNAVPYIEFRIEQLKKTIEILWNTSRNLPPNSLTGNFKDNNFLENIEIQDLLQLYINIPSNSISSSEISSSISFSNYKNSFLISDCLQKLFKMLLENGFISPQFKKNIQDLIPSNLSASYMPPLPQPVPQYTPEPLARGFPLTDKAHPFDIKQLKTLADFIKFKDSLSSQPEAILLEILRRVHGIVNTKQEFYNLKQSDEADPIFNILIDLLMNKFNKFNSLEVSEIVLLASSCWDFPLSDTKNFNLLELFHRVFRNNIRSEMNPLEIIKRLIICFISYISDRVKDHTLALLSVRLEKLIKTIESLISIYWTSTFDGSINNELFRDPTFIKNLVKLHEIDPYQLIHQRYAYQTDQDKQKFKKSCRHLFNILLKNELIVPEFKESIQRLVESTPLSSLMPPPLPQPNASISSTSSLSSSSRLLPLSAPPPLLKNRSKFSSWNEEYLDNISHKEVVSGLSSKEIAILQENYQALAKQIEQKWTQKHIQPTLSHLLKCSKGKRTFNLMHDSIEDQILQEILQPFIDFFKNHLPLEVELKKMSFKHYIHLFLLADAIRSCGLEIPNALDEIALKKFEARLTKIFLLSKDNIEAQSLINYFKKNNSQISKVSPLKICTEKEDSYKIGIYNALFVLTLKQLQTRGHHVKALLLQETIPTKVTSGCFVYYHDEKIELYPLKLELDPQTCNVLAVGLDHDHLVSKMMHLGIPALKKASPQAEGFSLNFEESDQILDFYKNHRENFYLLTTPKESDFLQKKAISLVQNEKESKERADLKEEEEGEGEEGDRKLSFSNKPQVLSSKAKTEKGKTESEKKTKKEDDEGVEGERKIRKESLKNSAPFNPSDFIDDLQEMDEDYVEECEQEGSVGSEVQKKEADQKEELLFGTPLVNSSSSILTSIKNPFEADLMSFCLIAVKGLEKCLQHSKTLSDSDFFNTTCQLTDLLARIVSLDPATLSFCDSLKNYQKNAVAWALSLTKLGLGGILASAPGLGKTRQAIEFMRQLQKQPDSAGRPLLVIAPNSLVEQWKDELLLRLFVQRKELFESLLRTRPSLLPIDLDKWNNGLSLFVSSQEEQIFLLQQEKEKIVKARGEMPSSLSLSSSSSSPSKELLKMTENVKKLEVLEKKLKMLHERLNEARELFAKVVEAMPEFSLNAISKWKAQIGKENFENSACNKWLAIWLLNAPALKIPDLSKVICKHFGNPRLMEYKNALIRGLNGKREGPFSEDSFLEILKKELDTAASRSPLFNTPAGLKCLIAFGEELFSKVSVSSTSSIFFKGDDSLLSVNMYEQVLVCTAETQKAFVKELRNPHLSTKWRIVVASQTSLQMTEDKKSKNQQKNVLIEAFETMPWQAVITDEAHLNAWDMGNIGKKIGSQCALEFSKKLQLKGAHRLLLTGTPFVNEYRETVSLMQLANPHLDFSGLVKALSQREATFSASLKKSLKKLSEHAPLKESLKNSLTTHFNSLFIAREHLRSIFQQLFCIHETQDPLIQKDWTVDEVLYLPQKKSIALSFPLTEQQTVSVKSICSAKKINCIAQRTLENALFHPDFTTPAYNLKEAEMQQKIASFSDSEIAKFIAASGFLTTFFADIPSNPLIEAISNGESFLIIVPQIKHGVALQKLLERKFKSTQTLFFHGEKSLAERDYMVKTFEAAAEKERTPHCSTIFILSLKAGGVGLNLKNASRVFNFASWWNDAVTVQVEARALRAGVFGIKTFYSYISAVLALQQIKNVVQRKNLIKDYYFSKAGHFNKEDPKTILQQQKKLFLEACRAECMVDQQHPLIEEFRSISEILEGALSSLLPRLCTALTFKKVLNKTPVAAPASLSSSSSSSSSLSPSKQVSSGLVKSDKSPAEKRRREDSAKIEINPKGTQSDEPVRKKSTRALNGTSSSKGTPADQSSSFVAPPGVQAAAPSLLTPLRLCTSKSNSIAVPASAPMPISMPRPVVSCSSSLRSLSSFAPTFGPFLNANLAPPAKVRLPNIPGEFQVIPFNQKFSQALVVTIFKSFKDGDASALAEFFHHLSPEDWEGYWKNPESFQKKYGGTPTLLKWKELHNRVLRPENKGNIASWNKTHKISVFSLVNHEMVLIQEESFNQDKMLNSCRLLKTIGAEGHIHYAFLIRLK